MFNASNTSIHSLSSTSGRKHYMPGLDGLRALSVLAVIAYHLKLPWAPGGLLGVGIFFTLSGYLITDQLLMEWQRARRFDLKRFWMRRVRRLLPAMFIMLALVSLWLYCFDRPRLISLQGDILSAILYFNNWWLIFHQVSYFESFGAPSPIGHLWSLAIEEQFYILWPLLLALIMWIPRRGLQTFIILMGAVASAAAMAFIYQPGTDPSRVYYGTDTRAFALLIGAGLAMIWPSRDLPRGLTGKSQIILDLIGGAGLLTIILFMGSTNEYDPSLYNYGLAVFAILSAIVIAAMAHPASLLSKLLGCKPLRWLGVRSYSLYLWHYPVITLTNPAIDTGDFNIGRVAFQLVLTILLAATSWRFIEEPILSGRLRPLRAISPGRTSKTRYALIAVVSILILMVIPGSGNIMQDKTECSPSASAEGNTDKRLLASGAQALFTSDGTTKQTTINIPGQKPPVYKESKKSIEVHSGLGITAIGDSVILDVARDLEKLLPGIIIDGKVGRQMYQSQAVVDFLKAEGKLGEIVIIELGTNGPFSEKQLMSLLTSLGDVEQIVLVNTRVPRTWQDTVNNDLQKAVAEIPNAVLVDWFSASKGHNSYFSPDGVHLSPEGASNYAAMLSQAIYKGR